MTVESGGQAAPDPAATPGRGVPTEEERRRTGRRRLLILGVSTWVGSYGLTMAIFSDALFIFGIPGIIGLATATVMTAVGWMYKSPRTVPYATDGTELRGALKHHRLMVAGRFLVLLLVVVALGALPLTTDVPYFFPLLVVGVLSLVVGTVLLVQQSMWLRYCAGALNEYDVEFRAPVEKLGQQNGAKRLLRFGEGPPQASRKMSVRQFRGLDWPETIGNGVWFAGDDMFGGVVLVPGSGELLLVQPQDWAASQSERSQVGAERQRTAERAGLGRPRI